MNTISAETVRKTIFELTSISQKETKAIINEISRKQPLIMEYLFEVDDEFFIEEGEELLLYLLVTIWQIMSKGDEPIPEVTEELLDEKENKNLNMIATMSHETEAGFVRGLQKMVSEYNQSEIFMFLIQVLAESLEDGIIDIGDVGFMLLYLKTVIDCFDD
jgi:hypothetical protein